MKINFLNVAVIVAVSSRLCLAGEVVQLQRFAVRENDFGAQSINTIDVRRTVSLSGGAKIIQVAGGITVNNGFGLMEINHITAAGIAAAPQIIQSYDVAHTNCRANLLSVNSIKAGGFLGGGVTLSYSGYVLTTTYWPIIINSYVY
jgi:hypothetical protein